MLNHAGIYADIRDYGSMSGVGSKAQPEFGNGLALVCIKTKKLTSHQQEVLTTGFVDNMDATTAVCQLLSAIKDLMQKHGIEPDAEIIFRVKVPEHLKDRVGQDTIDIAYDELYALHPAVTDNVVEAILDNEMNTILAALITGEDVPSQFKRPS